MLSEREHQAIEELINANRRIGGEEFAAAFLYYSDVCICCPVCGDPSGECEHEVPHCVCGADVDADGSCLAGCPVSRSVA